MCIFTNYGVNHLNREFVSNNSMLVEFARRDDNYPELLKVEVSGENVFFADEYKPEAQLKAKTLTLQGEINLAADIATQLPQLMDKYKKGLGYE